MSGQAEKFNDKRLSKYRNLFHKSLRESQNAELVIKIDENELLLVAACRN